MKKSLLVLAFAMGGICIATAQNYFFLKTKGTTDPYAMNPPAATPGLTSIIAGTSTPIANQLSTTQQLPFAWDFYGNTVTDYKVSTSGYLTFDPTLAVDNSSNVSLPNAAAPRSTIFAFWDNLRVQSLVQGSNTFPSDIRSWTYGTAPKRVHVVQWRLIQTNDATNGTNVTYFAVRIYEEGKFDIVLNYGFGAFKATVGCQNVLGTVGVQLPGSPDQNFGGPNGSPSAALSDVYTFNFGTQIPYDIKLTGVEVPKVGSPNQPANIGYSFVNIGAQTITSFRVNYSVDGGALVSQNVTGVSVLGSGIGTYSFNHATPYTPVAIGVKSVKVTIDNFNGANADGNPTDNELTKSLSVFSKTVKRKSLYEVYTASTCPPCRPGNEVLQKVFQQRMGGYTVIKYQYNFPLPGDPYYTSECATRGSYYGGISSVPRLQVDGAWNSNPNSFTSSIFDQYYQKPAVVGITANQVTTDTSITVNATITPVVSLAGNFKVHVAILERLTTRNKKNNGETEFYWVMKKMLPNASGSTINLSVGTPVQITQTYTLRGGYRLPSSASDPINLASENSVEEANDLIGVVFVQDESDREVLQSEWSVNAPWDYYAAVSEKAIANLNISMYPNPAQTTLTINTADVKETTAIRVVDLTGKEVLNATANGGLETAIDVSALSNGIYFVQLTLNGNTAIQKLVISK